MIMIEIWMWIRTKKLVLSQWQFRLVHINVAWKILRVTKDDRVWQDPRNSCHHINVAVTSSMS
jgi:hypothetical protein